MKKDIYAQCINCVTCKMVFFFGHRKLSLSYNSKNLKYLNYKHFLFDMVSYNHVEIKP